MPIVLPLCFHTPHQSLAQVIDTATDFRTTLLPQSKQGVREISLVRAGCSRGRGWMGGPARSLPPPPHTHTHTQTADPPPFTPPSLSPRTHSPRFNCCDWLLVTPGRLHRPVLRCGPRAVGKHGGGLVPAQSAVPHPVPLGVAPGPEVGPHAVSGGALPCLGQRHRRAHRGWLPARV